jgi:hypothetical protein
MKRKGGREPARYERDEATRKRDAAEAAKLQEEAAARSFKVWRQRAEATCAAAERERRAASEKYWASVDPAQRLRRVRPFDLSPEHGITKDVLRRMEEIKLATLGYLESTIVFPDESRRHLSEGPLGAVASQEDAERLVAALTAAFPHIPFSFELMEELLENVKWRGIDDVASDDAP